MVQFCIMVMLYTAVSGKIQGIITDEDTGKPIPYAHVSILDAQTGAAAAEDGTFFVLGVTPGRYAVEFSHIGYQTKLINDVIVEIDHTTRLEITLKQSPIDITPVTVTSKTPFVTKDMTGTTYIIREAELAALPIDHTVELIAFQPSVAHLDTALHVRGGRVTEVLYMVDNVSIIDPHTGDPVLSMPKGVLSEVIFLPGGYDVECGRAMSGMVNLITEYPRDKLYTSVYGKSERIMPYDYDFGYENYQVSMHLPISRKSKGLIAFDLMQTIDWNPRLHVLPHKQRDDYTLYGKWLFAPSGKLRLTLSGVKSRVQFDRYDSQWKFNLNHYRSDLIDGNLQVINISFLPDSRKLFNLTLSRLHATKIYGVREWGPYGLFENFTFKDSSAIKWPTYSIRNPYGADFYVEADIPLYDYPLTDGDYPEYRRGSSNVFSIKGSSRVQVHKYHEVKGGFEYTFMGLKNFDQFVPNEYLLFGREYKLTDEYTYNPKEYSMFVQDNIDYKGLYARVGLRYDRFKTGIDGVEPKAIISPRCGASFMVTEKFLFRANIGLYAQPPLYDYLYSYHNILPLPSHLERFLPLVGNPNLDPEKTMSYEIGLQGIINEGMRATMTVFYKDVFDLIGTRFIPAAPRDYVRYENVEYANIRGMEMIIECANSLFAGKMSYTLSWAKGTSSYAEEVYDILDWYEIYDTITYHAEEYYLNFDQRHRIFVQGVINLPQQTKLHIFGYLGSGFPYTPPGEEGITEERNALRLEFQKQVDCVLSKSFRIGRFSLDLNLEILNLLGERYQIRWHGPLIPYAGLDYQDFYRYYFNHIYYVINRKYSPPADENHDGIITPREQYNAFLGLVSESDDWVNSYSAPRRARLGLSLAF
jgi:hypothetical protein